MEPNKWRKNKNNYIKDKLEIKNDIKVFLTIMEPNKWRKNKNNYIKDKLNNNKWYKDFLS